MLVMQWTSRSPNNDIEQTLKETLYYGVSFPNEAFEFDSCELSREGKDSVDARAARQVNHLHWEGFEQHNNRLRRDLGTPREGDVREELE